MIYTIIATALVALVGGGLYIIGQMASFTCKSPRAVYRLGFLVGSLTWYVVMAVVKFSGLAQ